MQVLSHFPLLHVCSNPTWLFLSHFYKLNWHSKPDKCGCGCDFLADSNSDTLPSLLVGCYELLHREFYVDWIVDQMWSQIVISGWDQNQTRREIRTKQGEWSKSKSGNPNVIVWPTWSRQEPGVKYCGLLLETTRCNVVAPIIVP
jgi:hypothetical protein